MPVITVQFIKDVVATPEQKRELLIRLTDAFIGIVGEVTRPFVYCIIKETPQAEWSIAGVPMPDLVYLTSPKHAQVIAKSNELMRGAIEMMKQQQQPQVQQAASNTAPAAAGNGSAATPSRSRNDVADKIWRGALEPTSGGSSGAPKTDRDADSIWRGADSGVKRNSPNSSGAGSSAAHYPRTAEELAAQLAAEAAEAEKVRVKRNREVIHRFYQAVNTKHRDEFYKIVHPNFVNHGGATGDLVGPKALVDSLDPFFTAMPDWHVGEDYVVAQGDKVASRGTITGTHLGPFMGAPPTGKSVAWTGIIIYRLDEDGMVVERWQDFDAMSMLQQLGVIPSPGAAPAR